MNSNSKIEPKLRHSLLLIGPKTGETVMGVSVAFDLLSDHLKEIGGKTKEVNLTQSGAASTAGRFRWGRMGFTVARVVESWFKMLTVSAVYLIVSTSVLGFIKDFLVILVASLLRKKIIIHLHGGGYRLFYEQQSPFRQRIIRWTLRRTTRIIVLGELLRSQFDFLDAPELIVVVPNGMAHPTGSQSMTPKLAPAENEPWRCLYLSNLMETKGYYVLLEACEQLSCEQSFNFHIDFCGGFIESSAEAGGAARADQLQAEFTRKLAGPPLNKFATYHGTVGGAKKEKLLEDAHVLILPTWYPWEGQPLSIIEAMACGTPVISSEHAGIPEEIVHDKTGWMLKSDKIDKEHLSELLSKMMNMSANEYSEMSQQAYQFYLDHFTKEKHLDNMLEVINGV